MNDSVLQATVTDRFSVKPRNVKKYETENYLQGNGYVDKEWTNALKDRNKKTEKQNSIIAKNQVFKQIANKISNRSQSQPFHPEVK